MFFNESEQLRLEHPSLASLISQIDDHLSEFDGNGLANPGIFASLLRADQHQILSIFERLRDLGVLDYVNLCECHKCKRLLHCSEYQMRLAAGEEFYCTDCETDLIQHPPRFLKEFRLSPRALHQTTKNKMAPKTKADHLVLLIHGIRTDAVWQEKVAAEMNLLPKVEALPIGYGILDIFRFWCPFFTRKIALKRIEDNRLSAHLACIFSELPLS